MKVCERWSAQYIREPRVGLSRARNRGAQNCTSEIVAFIDDDAIPSQNWLCRLIQEFRDPNVIATTGPIHPLIYTSQGEVRPHSGVIKGRIDRRVFDLSDPDWFAKSNFGGIGDGSNMAFRREAFKAWPGFHESLGRGTVVHGGEEHYAFFELIRLGQRIAFTPLAIVYHPFPDDPESVRVKELTDLCAATAYMCFFFVQQPQYRIALVRFLLRAAVRRIVGRPKDAANSFGRELKSVFTGLMQYFRSRPPRSGNSSIRHGKETQYDEQSH